MPTGRLPIWRLVTLSYVDLWRALRVMPLLFGCAVLIVLAVRVASQLLPQRLEHGPLLGTLSGIVEDAVQYFCLTPIMIAIHRFVIRGEVTRSYTVDPGDEAFWPFFIWLMVISIIFALVSAVGELLGGKAGAAHLPFATFAALMIVFIVAIWLSLRLLVLFPAIAVGAHDASPSQAFATTKGYGARLFAIVMLAFILPLAVGILIVLALGRGLMVRGSVPFVIGDITSALNGTFMETLGVVIASHVYLAIGRTVR